MRLACGEATYMASQMLILLDTRLPKTRFRVKPYVTDCWDTRGTGLQLSSNINRRSVQILA